MSTEDQETSESRWVNQDNAEDTGVAIDEDYLSAHETETTVSVGYSGEKPSGQQLSRDAKDGSMSSTDGLRDSDCKQHTVANEDSSIIATTFYANQSGAEWDEGKYAWLWKLHTGKDGHKCEGGNDNPRHKEDAAARFNHERAEIMCDQCRLTPQQKRAVLNIVDGTNFSRFTYLCQQAERGGAVEVTTVGIITAVLAYWCDNPLQHPAVEEAAGMCGITDVEYVAGEVADKKDFEWQ